MALRDQPYLPLYVQDFLTDEKLSECSAAATGVYIRLMCLMHKNDPYGKILLKQKHKQNGEQIKNFASQLVKNMPYDFHTVANALVELIDENVLSMENGVITQKRMVKDNEISEKRAAAGKNGAEKKKQKGKNFAKANAKAKVQANTEYEYVNENKDSFEEKEGVGEKETFATGIYSTDIPKNLKLDYLQIGQTQEFIRITTKQNLSPPEIEEQFEAFKIQNLSKKQLYGDLSELVSHFRNSLKLAILKNGAHQQTSATNQRSNGDSSSSKLGSKSGGFGLLTEALKGSR